jgi:P27 family predicted phage terminase small subunit
MAGRRPKPTALKLLDGNPGHRALNRNEPQPGGIPSCPRHLDAVAKSEWKRISRELIATGLLTSVDRAALAAYCAAWSRWVNAETSIEKFGAVIKSPKSGYPIQNPYIGIANTAIDQMRRFMIEFGMTPASRSRIHVNSDTGNTDDAFDNFMRGIGAMNDTPAHEDSESDELCEARD